MCDRVCAVRIKWEYAKNRDEGGRWSWSSRENKIRTIWKPSYIFTLLLVLLFNQNALRRFLYTVFPHCFLVLLLSFFSSSTSSSSSSSTFFFWRFVQHYFLHCIGVVELSVWYGCMCFCCYWNCLLFCSIKTSYVSNHSGLLFSFLLFAAAAAAAYFSTKMYIFASISFSRVCWFVCWIFFLVIFNSSIQYILASYFSLLPLLSLSADAIVFSPCCSDLCQEMRPHNE